MGVHLISETEGEEQTRLILKKIGVQPERTEEPAPPKNNPPGRESLIEAMGILARILGFRVQLFVGFLGAAGIGAYSVAQPSPMSLTAAGMFDLLVFAPLAFIAYRRG